MKKILSIVLIIMMSFLFCIGTAASDSLNIPQEELTLYEIPNAKYIVKIYTGAFFYSFSYGYTPEEMTTGINHLVPTTTYLYGENKNPFAEDCNFQSVTVRDGIRHFLYIVKA